MSNNPTVVTAIISSGHDVFIERVFELYKLSPPDILISDDYMRRHELRLYKPDLDIWEHVLAGARRLGRQPRTSIYIGDSRHQDGGLARNALIKFLQFAGEESVWHGHDGTIDHWDGPELSEYWSWQESRLAEVG